MQAALFLIGDNDISEWAKLYLVQRNLWSWKVWTRKPWTRKLEWTNRTSIVFNLSKGTYRAVDARLYLSRNCSAPEMLEAVKGSLLDYLLVFIDENNKLSVHSKNIFEDEKIVTRVENLLRSLPRNYD